MPTIHRYSPVDGSAFEVTALISRVIKETCELAQAAEIPKALIEPIAAHVYERPVR